MKIGHKESDDSSLKQFFKNRKLLLRAVLSLGGIGVLVVLFLAIAGYGAYMGKIGQFAYSKPLMLKVSDLDFSFLSDYANGELSQFEAVEIDIKPKHMDQLQSLRDRILREGAVDDAILTEEVPARLIYQGQTYEVKIELAGKMAIHFNDPAHWPLQIESRKSASVANMKRFDLLPPATGGYMTDWLGNEILKGNGIKTMKGDFVKLSINSKPLGVYYLQERFHKDLIESRRFGEGILFKVEEDMVVEKEEELMNSSDTKGHLLTLRRMWTDLRAGLLTVDQFFDLEKMGKLFAVADLMNQQHPVLRENLSFYFNPQTGRAEPVPCEFNNLNNSRNRAFSSTVGKPKPESPWHHTLAQDPLLQQIIGHYDFKRAYLREAEELTREDFIENLLLDNGGKVNVLLNRVYKNWPGHDLPTASLPGNQRYLRFVLFPDEGEVTAYFNRAEDGFLEVSLLNQQDVPLEVGYLGWRDTVIFQPAQPITLEGGKGQPKAYRFQVPPQAAWADSMLAELKVYFNLPGLTGKRSALVFPWAYEERRAHNGNPIVRPANHHTFAFVEEVPETNVITIPKGNWTLSRDLVIPAGRRLEVEAGARIDMVNQAKVICYSPVYFMGTEQDSILVHSSDRTAQGWIIFCAKERSLLEYTTFDHLNCSKENGWGVSGAVVFYEAPVDFNAVAFIGNQVGDDFLNVIRADFTMENSLFRDINADAFDCDFCTGTVSHSSFIDVGNDGIDVSGTEITVSHVSLVRIGDKGLSAGEGSNMTARHITIADSEIGFTSKDRSHLIISDSKVANTRIGITIFMKKSEYGPAYVQADGVQIEGAEIPYLIETNSGFLLDGVVYEANREDVKKILYGAEFGKASVR
ncbi:MAG: CotH kinase family protein [Lewinellaceae bacterium]|nr:CotH kinase family protein [Lewinellaceae bacterium]